jgi:hypothetical protein
MFKKSAILLAISTLAVGAQAAELSAGEGTKFQINVDVGAYYKTIKGEAPTGEDTKNFLGKGLNQVEIKATHKISDDISVFGEIEVDYDPIGDGDTGKTDDMRIGVASKSFGRVSAGQFDNYFEDNVLEVLNINRGDAASISNFSAGSVKDRTIEYTHKMGDVSIGLDYAFTRNNAKNDETTDLSNSTALTALYKLGSVTLGAGYASFGDYDDEGADQAVDTTTAFSVSYAMGATKLAGLYAVEKAVDGDKTTGTGFAVTHTMGKFGAGINYLTVDEDGEDKRNEMGLSFGYKPFKGMEVFLDLVKFDDEDDVGDTMEVGVKYKF